MIITTFRKKIVTFGIIIVLKIVVMRNLRLIVLILSMAAGVTAQETNNGKDNIRDAKLKPVPVYSSNYMNQYRRAKRLVVKVYPYALYAADLLDEIDQNGERIEKRRKQNKFYKEAYKDLKEDFKYFILDLYTSEGIMLMKLIHRETNLTVYEIAEKYRGKKNAELFQLMGKMWDQDLKIEFKPNSDDKIVEHVIQDIQNGIIPFDDSVEIVDKESYKENLKEYKDRKKANKKKRRKQKKKCDK